MCVDVTHLVLESLCDTGDHVFDNGADGTQASDALAVAVVQFDVDGVFSGLREAYGEMAEGSFEFA